MLEKIKKYIDKSIRDDFVLIRKIKMFGKPSSNTGLQYTLLDSRISHPNLLIHLFCRNKLRELKRQVTLGEKNYVWKVAIYELTRSGYTLSRTPIKMVRACSYAELLVHITDSEEFLCGVYPNAIFEFIVTRKLK